MFKHSYTHMRLKSIQRIPKKNQILFKTSLEMFLSVILSYQSFGQVCFNAKKETHPA